MADIKLLRIGFKILDIRHSVTADAVDFPIYFWSVFFKVDGSTVKVGNDLKLNGNATVVGTPGNHGNLGDGNRSDIPIPAAMGEYRSPLEPIQVQPIPGLSVGGVIGCVVILMADNGDVEAIPTIQSLGQ